MTRGIYASIRSTKLGKFVLPTIATNILGSPVNEQAFIDYVVKNKFSSVTFYDLNKILGDHALEQQLAKFIFNLKMNGVTEVNGAVAARFQVMDILLFNTNYAVQFNGIVTELEFWNGLKHENDFIDLILLLATAKTYRLQTTTYIGYLDRFTTITTDRVASTLATFCDRILVHAYVKDPAQAIGYIQSRVDILRKTSPSIYIWPIFSVEGPGTATGDEIFMGDYWKKNPSFQNVENLVPGFSGYQWFEYGILRAYG